MRSGCAFPRSPRCNLSSCVRVSSRPRPQIVVHVNYHPEKWERMKAVISKWVNGDDKALDSFPDGSQRRHQRRGLSGWMPELPAGLQQSRRGG